MREWEKEDGWMDECTWRMILARLHRWISGTESSWRLRKASSGNNRKHYMVSWYIVDHHLSVISHQSSVISHHIPSLHFLDLHDLFVATHAISKSVWPAMTPTPWLPGSHGSSPCLYPPHTWFPGWWRTTRRCWWREWLYGCVEEQAWRPQVAVQAVKLHIEGKSTIGEWKESEWMDGWMDKKKRTRREGASLGSSLSLSWRRRERDSISSWPVRNTRISPEGMSICNYIIIVSLLTYLQNGN